MELNNKSLFRQECFVNGDWVKSHTEKTLDVNNPATQEIIGKVPNFTAQETKSVIENANTAFETWKNITANVLL